jgi:hypothetical protein
MVFRWLVVILGSNAPLFILFTSRIALAFAELPSVFTATCEKELITNSRKRFPKIILFIMNIYLN